MPACVVMSVNSILPDGREGFSSVSGSGFDEGGGAAAVGGACTAVGAVGSLDVFVVQPAKPTIAASTKQTTRRRGIKRCKFLSGTITEPPSIGRHWHGGNPSKSRSAWRLDRR